jgi:TatA/E family protein of Tat protein translocase
MFGNIGFPELLFILVIALLVFGPKKLPEVGKSIGKALREFRRTSDEIKGRIEEEIRVSEFKDIKEDLKKDLTLDKKDFGLDFESAPPEAPKDAAEDGEVKKHGEGQ